MRAAKRYAKNFAFDIVEYVGPYKDWLAYHATSKELQGTTHGYPNFIIVRSDMCCRLSTPDEALDILNADYKHKVSQPQ